MRCSSCGKEIPDQVRFCPKCGKEQGAEPAGKKEKKPSPPRKKKTGKMLLILLCLLAFAGVVFGGYQAFRFLRPDGGADRSPSSKGVKEWGVEESEEDLEEGDPQEETPENEPGNDESPGDEKGERRAAGDDDVKGAESAESPETDAAWSISVPAETGAAWPAAAASETGTAWPDAPAETGTAWPDTSAETSAAWPTATMEFGTGTALPAGGGYEAGDYIIPDSASRYLETDDLIGLNLDQLRLARNEIYARHGRLFKDEGLQAYFDSKSWYNGTIEPGRFSDQSMLNDYEKKNLIVIQKREEQLKR